MSPGICWDGDFLFDTEDGSFSAMAAVEHLLPPCGSLVRSTSGTNEDWDLELSLGETPKALVLNDEAEDATARSSASMVDDKQVVIVDRSGTPVESLLEYLDEYAMTDAMVFCVTHRIHALPRQPTLFSAYATYQRQQEKDLCKSAIQSNSAHLTSHLSTLPPMSLDVRIHWDLHASTAVCSSPHAPESALGTVAWLQNLCCKVSHTSAVVARPSPERVGNMYERERPPSEEAALERALRAAEMAYCNGNWQGCGTHAKALLCRLESSATATPTALRVVSFGDGHSRPQTLDDDLRCHQCCGRLARLVCRLVQRHDELCAAELPCVTNTNRRLVIPRGLSASLQPLDAGDITAFCRGTTALIDDIDDAVIRAKSKLIVDEALAHLALVLTYILCPCEINMCISS